MAPQGQEVWVRTQPGSSLGKELCVWSLFLFYFVNMGTLYMVFLPSFLKKLQKSSPEDADIGQTRSHHIVCIKRYIFV